MQPRAEPPVSSGPRRDAGEYWFHQLRSWDIYGLQSAAVQMSRCTGSWRKPATTSSQCSTCGTVGALAPPRSSAQ
eukprot:9409371-Lingulodinium_polyedra.AAC.1